MKQRGRKSAAKLAIATTSVTNREPAPEKLTPDERLLWDAVVSSRVAGFFDSATLPLLAEFCRLQTEVDLLAAQIGAFDEDWLITDEGVKRYAAIANIRDKAQGRLIGLARSMRLTQRSRAEAASNRPKTSQARIWQKEA